MKIVKKIVIMLLALTLIVPCFSVVSYAAEGVIFFTDLETKVGDTFEITGTVVSKGGTLKDVSIEMSYDTTYVQFMSGDNINADSAGKLTYTGTGSSDRLEFTMTFQALQVGTTRLNQDSATVTTTDGENLNCTVGYSDLVIGEGDPSKITQPSQSGGIKEVTIDGQPYTISEAFSDNEIPDGFLAGEITYGEGTYKGAVQETGDLALAYLVDASQVGEFWVYNAKEQTFAPCEEILISDEYSIIILDGRKEVDMPDKYEEGTMEINGNAFPIWHEPERDGFYVLYAVNNIGDKSLYMYDSLEHTYQRIEMPKETAKEKTPTTVWSKISEFLTNYLIWFCVGIGCILIIFIIFLIVLGVKLHHRNVELDELYDEYSIDEEPKEVAYGSGKQSHYSNNPDDDDDFYEDDYYDEENDYYDEEDDLDDLRLDFNSISEEKHNFDDYYDEDDYDDIDIGMSEHLKRKKDDTFTMDFIDLD